MNVRPYHIGDEKEIINLFGEVFHKEMPLEYWNWRYANNPCTNTQFISLCWSGDKLVGHYAASPVELIVDGSIVLSALSMTTMTHPKFSRLGIFTTLAGAVNSSLHSRGYAAIWGFPNLKSHFGLINGLGWKDVGIITFLSLSSESLVKRPTSEIPVKKHKLFTDRIAESFYRMDCPVQVNRSSAYLNWRFIDNPTNQYEVIEYDEVFVIYKIIPSFENQNFKEIDIVDFSANLTYKSLKTIITYLSNSCVSWSRINVWQHVHTKYYKMFERIGFQPALPLTYFSLKPFGVVNPGILDLRSWDISMSYSDVF